MDLQGYVIAFLAGMVLMSFVSMYFHRTSHHHE